MTIRPCSTSAISPHGRWRHQVPGFAIAGVIATLAHWAVMGFLMKIVIFPAAATAIGSMAGAMINYGLQRRLAFRHAGPHKHTIALYLISCCVAWSLNLLLFAMFTGGFSLPIKEAQLLTTLLVAGLNFVVYKKLVFL